MIMIKVNSFIVEKNILISPNYILPKSMYYCVFRCVICQDIARGRREGKAIRHKWRSSMCERLCGAPGQPTTCCYKSKVQHNTWPACQLGQNHISVDMYQSESNKVNLGQNQTSFEPRL
jgi:hypothetical protein